MINLMLLILIILIVNTSSYFNINNQYHHQYYYKYSSLRLKSLSSKPASSLPIQPSTAASTSPSKSSKSSKSSTSTSTSTSSTISNVYSYDEHEETQNSIKNIERDRANAAQQEEIDSKRKRINATKRVYKPSQSSSLSSSGSSKDDNDDISYNSYSSNSKQDIRERQQLLQRSLVKYQSLNDDDKNEFLASLISKQHHQVFVALLKSLASRKQRIFPNKIILNLILKSYNDLEASDLCDLIWSLSKLGINLREVNDRELVMLLIHRFCEIPNLTPRQVTTSLGGLAALRLSWNRISIDIRNDLLKAVGLVSRDLNCREVGNLFHSLSKIAITWQEIPIDVQDGLLSSFVKYRNELVSQQGAMTIYSFGVLGIETDSLDISVKNAIDTVVYEVLSEIEDDSLDNIEVKSVMQQSSNVIYGIGKIKYSYEGLSQKLKAAFIRTLTNIKYMNEQEVANTIYSMGLLKVKWKELPSNVRDILQEGIIAKFPLMITQGISNTIYGMHVMEATWDSVSPLYVKALHQALIDSFSRNRSVNREGSSQAIANVIYALGVLASQSSSKYWDDYPKAVQEALKDGLREWGHRQITQESSNTFYGLGLLNAEFDVIPGTMLTSVIDRLYTSMNEQEVCSTIYGLAKMRCPIWHNIPDTLKKAFYSSFLRIDLNTDLTLGCITYSLGSLTAVWDNLPYKIRDIITNAIENTTLLGQRMSNVMYGLSLAKCEWNDFKPSTKDALLKNLANPDLFKDEEVAQHISNTLWALSKMEVLWPLLPGRSLEESVVRCARYMNTQELSNSVYALAIMGAQWLELTPATRQVIRDTIVRVIQDEKLSITIQEVANLMYSIALLTFDCMEESVNLSGYEQKLLEDIHNALISNFIVSFASKKGGVIQLGINMENYDQFQIYFDLLDQLPFRKIVLDKLGVFPKCSGPCGTIPSTIHGMVANAMLSSLHEVDASYEIYNEFNGFTGVFPLDIAVYKNNNLVAFVEIDGAHHYNIEGKLKRKDCLKEFLYSKKYPDIQIFRIRADQCEAIGNRKAGHALATWILKK